MKKNIIKTIALLLVFTFIVGSVFTMSGGEVEAADSNSKAPFNYKITPYSPKWKDFTTQELKEMLNIPLEEAEKMDTKTLLKVVLDYPYLGDIYAFDDPIKALDFLAEQFNGLKVLLERENLKDELLKNYIDSSAKTMKLNNDKEIGFEDTFKHKYRESLFAHPKVFNKLSKKEKDIIIKNSKKVSSKMKIRDITKREYKTFGMETRYTLDESVPVGEPVDYAQIMTPMGTIINVEILQDYKDEAEREKDDEYMDTRYPNATRVLSSTYRFNCHSYAWYSQNTITNTYWLYSPVPYMLDGSYYQVQPYMSYVGDIIYYTGDQYQNPDGVWLGGQHSGIVTKSGGQYIDTTEVKSKWGIYGLYKHTINHCPYFSLAPVTYWRKN